MTEASSDLGEFYDRSFYAERNANTRYAAESVLSIVEQVVPPIHSATDLGCGVGVWLSVLKARGASRVAGFDGGWVKRDLLEIESDEFQAVDLSAFRPPTGKFDLAISLEVAEHLPSTAADGFVESLCQLSDFVLFSAAIPDQGGVNHINEQWQDYWAEKFAARGYDCFDIVRPQIWNDDRIGFPYRQNVLLYVRNDRVGELKGGVRPAKPGTVSMVHPYLFDIVRSKSVRRSLMDLRHTLVRRLGQAFGRGAA